MLVTVATAIAEFLFESAASGIVGQVAYETLEKLYQKRQGVRILHLYTKALKAAVDMWRPSLVNVSDDINSIRLDDKTLEEFFQRQGLQIKSLSTITEPELVQELSKEIDEWLILPGHQLTKFDLENLARELVRSSAELFVEEISHDETAFRYAVLQETRLAAYDRRVIIELLDRIPVLLRSQIEEIDNKIAILLQKMDQVLETIEFRERLPFTSSEQLAILCEHSVKQSISSIPKYNSLLYVERDALEWEFSQFISSKSPCLLAQGEAGVGKTNLLCHLAIKYSQLMPTLFFRGTTQISGRLGFATLLAEELSSLSRSPIEPAKVITFLDNYLETKQMTLIVFIDAINENRDVLSLKESLGYAIQDLVGTNIKLCMSCRDVDWRLFEDEDRIVRFLYEPKRSIGRTVNALYIESFTNKELQEAWEKYSNFYSLRGVLSTTLEDICRHPLMLQFLCEAFRGKAIPPGIHRKEIFDQYWKEKLRVRVGAQRELSIYTIVDELLQKKIVGLYESQVIQMIGAESYYSLLSEQVIIYTYSDPILSQNIIGFTYEAFFEYSLARFLRQKWDWLRKSEQDIKNDLKSLIEEVDSYRNLLGVLQYLLLFLGKSPVVANILLELAEKDNRWKIFFCDMQSKLDEPVITLATLPKLNELAQDDNPQVRWAVGSALGYVSLSRIANVDSYISRLINSPNWKNREVAAFVGGFNYKDLDEIEVTLRPLANDINWRVRRAVAYSITSLCISNSEKGFEILDSWSRSDSWRSRWVVAKSQKGLFINLDRTFSLLEKFTYDPSDDVRWITVIAYVSLAWVENKQVKKGLERLANDESTWVRKHLATWVPEFYQFLGEELDEIIIELSQDRDFDVRWELARSLGRLKSSQVFQRLSYLTNDNATQVRFAAIFSLSGTDAGGKNFSGLIADIENIQMYSLREKVARSSHLLRLPKENADLFNAWKGDRYASVMDAVNQETTFLVSQERIKEFFEFLLSDEDEGIRWALSSILASTNLINASDRYNMLYKLMCDTHYWVQREAITSLNKVLPLADNQIPDRIIKEVKNNCFHRNPEVRFASFSFLIEMNKLCPLNDNVLYNGCTDEDPQIRQLFLIQD
jgi:HEAT repeat protein